VLRSRTLAGAEVFFVVDVQSIGNRREAEPLPLRFEHIEQFIFAMKAAIRAVGCVVFTFQFIRCNRAHRNCLFLRELQRFAIMAAGQTGRIGNHGDHLLA
jgi:hypothetical protein